MTSSYFWCHVRQISVCLVVPRSSSVVDEQITKLGQIIGDHAIVHPDNYIQQRGIATKHIKANVKGRSTKTPFSEEAA